MPVQGPAISLYLDLTRDVDGTSAYHRFCRRAFADQVNAWTDRPAEQRILANGFDRIEAYLSRAQGPRARALAVFSAPGHGHDGFFAAMALDVPFDEHWLFVGNALHLAPLEALLPPPPSTPPTDVRGDAGAAGCESRYRIHDQRAVDVPPRGASNGLPHPSTRDGLLAASLWLRA